MTHKQKRLVKNGVILPVIIAVALTFVFALIIPNITDAPFSSKMTELAEYSSEEIKRIDSFEGTAGDTINKSEIGKIDGNTIIGSINALDSTFPLIYNANEVNASGKLNIKNNLLIGEVGAPLMEIYKNDSAKIKLLTKGDILTISTFYSVYEYEVVDTFVAKNKAELASAGSGVGRAVAFYTDNYTGVGISNEYYVVVGKMISGSKIER